MIARSDALKLLARLRTNEVVISTMSTLPEWKAYSNYDALDFPLIGAMGQVPCMALGIALAHPEKRVWGLNGDGSQLMHMGTIATIVHNDARNVVLFVFENDSYEQVGGAPIPLAGRVDFATAARGLGMARTYTFDDMATLEAQLSGILKEDGPLFIVLKAVRGEKIPPWMPKRVEEAIKLRQSLAAGL